MIPPRPELYDELMAAGTWPVLVSKADAEAYWSAHPGRKPNDVLDAAAERARELLLAALARPLRLLFFYGFDHAKRLVEVKACPITRQVIGSFEGKYGQFAEADVCSRLHAELAGGPFNYHEGRGSSWPVAHAIVRDLLERWLRREVPFEIEWRRA